MSSKAFSGNISNDYNKKENMQIKSNKYLTNSIECESDNLKTGEHFGYVNDKKPSST